jgi:hypothetical protein
MSAALDDYRLEGENVYREGNTFQAIHTFNNTMGIADS